MGPEITWWDGPNAVPEKYIQSVDDNVMIGKSVMFIGLAFQCLLRVYQCTQIPSSKMGLIYPLTKNPYSC